MPQTINLQELAQYAGIHYGHGAQVADNRNRIAMDNALVTDPNAGIPLAMATWIDPKVIDTIVAPMKMGAIFGEMKKGNWTDDQLTFIVAESTGDVSTYGDFSENGMAGANINYPNRNTYHYQTNVKLGEWEIAKAGAGRVDLVSKKQIAAQLTLNKFQNKSYIFGVEGLDIRGVMNDKDLPATTTVPSWLTMDGGQIYEEFRKQYSRLNKQTNGILDADSPMTWIISNNLAPELNKTNTYNVNVMDQLKKNYPNLTIETVPEYSTPAGEMTQLILREYEGQETLDLAFTEKMRAFAVVQMGSYFKQKRMQGTAGAVIYRPVLIETTLVAV